MKEAVSLRTPALRRQVKGKSDGQRAPQMQEGREDLAKEMCPLVSHTMLRRRKWSLGELESWGWYPRLLTPWLHAQSAKSRD